MLSRCITGSSTTVQRRNSFATFCVVASKLTASVKAKKHFSKQQACAHMKQQHNLPPPREPLPPLRFMAARLRPDMRYSQRAHNHTRRATPSPASCSAQIVRPDEQRSRCQRKQCQPKHVLENPLLQFRDQRQYTISTCKCPCTNAVAALNSECAMALDDEVLWYAE